MKLLWLKARFWYLNAEKSIRKTKLVTRDEKRVSFLRSAPAYLSPIPKAAILIRLNILSKLCVPASSFCTKRADI